MIAHTDTNEQHERITAALGARRYVVVITAQSGRVIGMTPRFANVSARKEGGHDRARVLLNFPVIGGDA